MENKNEENVGALDGVGVYPIPVEVNSYRSDNRSSELSGYSGGGALTRTAQDAMRNLLGWRYRADDPKGFLAALNKALDLKEVKGYTEWTWKNRPFMVQADLGEVTGAQASIYTRAKAALEQALPLLDRLKPLRADADKEEMESIRALVRSAWIEIVNELGIVSGPRVQRVDEYFKQLLGENALLLVYPRNMTNPETLQSLGMLGKLALRYGFRRDRVLTVDEEQNLTDWLILFDHTFSLCQMWTNQKASFEWDADNDRQFLGTQLVRLSQALAVLGENIRETYDAMDSVYFGADERNVTVLTFNHPNGPGKFDMSVSELLSWIEHFATVEGPQLIEDSGKDGVVVVSNMLDRFNDLLKQLVEKIDNWRS